MPASKDDIYYLETRIGNKISTLEDRIKRLEVFIEVMQKKIILLEGRKEKQSTEVVRYRIGTEESEDR